MSMSSGMGTMGGRHPVTDLACCRVVVSKHAGTEIAHTWGQAR